MDSNSDSKHMRGCLFPVTHCFAPLTFSLRGSVVLSALLPVAHLGTPLRHASNWRGTKNSIRSASGDNCRSCRSIAGAQRGSALARSDSSSHTVRLPDLANHLRRSTRLGRTRHPFTGRYGTYLTAIHPPDWLMSKPNCRTESARAPTGKRSLPQRARTTPTRITDGEIPGSDHRR
jgi:hypothetical protein